MKKATEESNSFRDNLEPVSRYDKYCDGFKAFDGSNGGGYFLGLVLAVGISELELVHGGSGVLEQINAFDRAEVSGTNIGQTNMVTVSSFCGPTGLIWGYDVVRPDDLYSQNKYGPVFVEDTNRKIPVYSINPLLNALEGVFGTVEKKRFPILPGAHVLCALKSFELYGKSHIYSAMALGIAKDRDRDACLLMEDLGSLEGVDDLETSREEIITNITKSVIKIGRNQKVTYKEIFAGMVDAEVPDGKVGCAIAAAPYFLLAKRAVLPGGVDELKQTSFRAWESKVNMYFLDR